MSGRKNVKGAYSEQKTKHHIQPRSRGGTNNPSNLTIKKRKFHLAYHLLFNNALPEEAVMILIKEWFYKDPDTRNRKLYQLVIELARLTTEYIERGT